MMSMQVGEERHFKKRDIQLICARKKTSIVSLLLFSLSLTNIYTIISPGPQITMET